MQVPVSQIIQNTPKVIYNLSDTIRNRQKFAAFNTSLTFVTSLEGS